MYASYCNSDCISDVETIFMSVVGLHDVAMILF